MLLLGVLMILIPAGGAGLLAWQNRTTLVRVHVGDATWTVNLYGVLVLGALLACWVLLGVAFVRCRIAERRDDRAGRAARRTERAGRGVPVS